MIPTGSREPVPSELSPVPWGMIEGLGAVAVTVLVQVLGALLLSAVVDVLGKTVDRGLTPLTGRATLWFEIATYQFLGLGVLLSVIFVILMRFRVGSSALGFRFPGWRMMAGAASAIIPIFSGIFLVAAFFDTFLPGYHLRGNGDALLAGASPKINVLQGILVIAFAAVEVPLVEETLFRGILYQGIRHFFERYLPYQGAVAAGAILSGTAFGLLHFQPHTLPILILLGIALAYVFQVTGSIYGSALVHAILNFVAVVSTFHITA
ncbi:MAG: hypothetical protein NVS2B16_30460 [Chloroflexota bacterium]